VSKAAEAGGIGVSRVLFTKDVRRIAG